MADTTLTGRLKRLFSGSTIVRNIGGRKLKVVDSSKIQASPQNSLVDRFQKIHSNKSYRIGGCIIVFFTSIIDAIAVNVIKEIANGISPL